MNNNSTYTRKFKPKVTLSYQGKYYIFVYDSQYEAEKSDAIYSLWAQGNFSCDCNRADFIAQYCDEDFPELECGNTIELIAFEEVEVGIVDGSVAPKEIQG